MSSQIVIENDLTKAQDSAMRVTARALIKAYQNNASNDIEDFIVILGWELSKAADDYARRTSDYSRSHTLTLIADHLMKLDDVIDNYDGTTE